MIFTKRVQSSYANVLRGKVYFFFKRSIWRYLLGIILISLVYPLGTFNIALSALIYFLALVGVVLVPVYHFSSKHIAKRNSFDADIEFNEQNIVIKHRNKDLTEIKEWAWIKQIDITEKAVFIVINQFHRFVIILGNNSLSEDELQFFRKMKSEKLR